MVPRKPRRKCSKRTENSPPDAQSQEKMMAMEKMTMRVLEQVDTSCTGMLQSTRRPAGQVSRLSPHCLAGSTPLTVRAAAPRTGPVPTIHTLPIPYLAQQRVLSPTCLIIYYYSASHHLQHTPPHPPLCHVPLPRYPLRLPLLLVTAAREPPRIFERAPAQRPPARQPPCPAQTPHRRSRSRHPPSCRSL